MVVVAWSLADSITFVLRMTIDNRKMVCGAHATLFTTKIHQLNFARIGFNKIIGTLVVIKNVENHLLPLLTARLPRITSLRTQVPISLSYSH